MSNQESPELPADYEPCGHCDCDHSYDYELAAKWHQENDPEGKLYE